MLTPDGYFKPDRFSAMLTAAIAERKFSVADVAKITGVPGPTIYRTIRGERPNIENFLRLMFWIFPQFAKEYGDTGKKNDLAKRIQVAAQRQENANLLAKAVALQQQINDLVDALRQERDATAHLSRQLKKRKRSQ